MHYLDNAATTRVADEVVDTASRVLREQFFNPSSLYAPAARAEELIEASRAIVADSLGAKPAEVFFTSGGTESNNMAILGALRAREAWAEHIVVTGFEHPSVHNTVKAMEKHGWRVTFIAPNCAGQVDLNALAHAVGTKTALCACIHVNNEIGTVLDVASLAREVKAKNSRTAVHVDGVQAWCRLPFKVGSTMIDTYAVSGHKIHAPKGIGALYVRRGFYTEPLMFGGEQERGMRPGTQNTPYITALGKAVQLVQSDKGRAERVRLLNRRLWNALADIDGIVRNSPEEAVEEIANFSVMGIRSEIMLHFLESKGIYVSSGSACAKGEASHTLTAMNLPKARVDSAIRVSFSGQSQTSDVDALVRALKEGIETLEKVKK